jgi:hypothetical protein
MYGNITMKPLDELIYANNKKKKKLNYNLTMKYGENPGELISTLYLLSEHYKEGPSEKLEIVLKTHVTTHTHTHTHVLVHTLA